MSISTSAELLAFLQDNGFLTLPQVQQLNGAKSADARTLARELVDRDWLTPYQANQILQGRGEEMLLGSYVILDRLGEGGMGQVFKARHVSMDRVVALKIIPKDRVANPTAVARFYREVRAVAKLSHPNIVTAFEANQIGHTHFLAMEYMDGIDLAKLVQQSGPLSIPRACEYVRQAAVGLQHAYEKGLVHRDIKPGNLVVYRPSPDEPPLIKILDFGLARFESESEHTGRLTQLDKTLGTVDYMAPEQAQNARTADIRADIYSLGCTLFTLLTGKPPFEGEDVAEKIGARVLGEVPSVRTSRPEVSPALEGVVAKMMARKPEDRYQTPGEVVKALEPHAQSEGEQRPAARTVLDRSPSPQPISPTLIEPPVRSPTPPLPKRKAAASQKAGEREPRPPRLKTSVWLALAGMGLVGAVALVGIIVGGILYTKSRNNAPTTRPALASKDTNADKSKPDGSTEKARPPADVEKPKLDGPVDKPRPPVESWKSLAGMPTARSLLAAVTGPDGRIYAIGGENASGRLDTVEVYDPSSNKWSTVASMPTGRNHLAATMGPDDLIYAIGGVGGANIVEAYNPSTNKWTTVAPLPTARHGLAAVTGPDGRIYAIGGNGPGGSLNTVEAYDPTTNTWATVAKMPTARVYLAAAMGPDGRIYAIGGFVERDGKRLNTVEAYDTKTNKWTTVASMPTARNALAAATGPDSRIYAIGGHPEGGNLNPVEAYDPTTNTWATVAKMPTVRGQLAAATGRDGRIYVIGGGGNVSYLNTVEALSFSPSK